MEIAIVLLVCEYSLGCAPPPAWPSSWCKCMCKAALTQNYGHQQRCKPLKICCVAMMNVLSALVLPHGFPVLPACQTAYLADVNS